MKYLKLYEQSETEYSLWNWCLNNGITDKETANINCSYRGITNLDGIENFPELESLVCLENKIKSLKGIENCKKLEKLKTQENQLSSVQELEGCINLKDVSCGYHRNLTSLKGMGKLYGLSILECSRSGLKNLEELKNLNLNSLYVPNNPFDVPLPFKLRNIASNPYSDLQLDKFSSYEYQKWFIEEHPEKIKDLERIGFNKKIKEEYKDLLDFFDIKI